MCCWRVRAVGGAGIGLIATACGSEQVGWRRPPRRAKQLRMSRPCVQSAALSVLCGGLFAWLLLSLLPLLSNLVLLQMVGSGGGCNGGGGGGGDDDNFTQVRAKGVLRGIMPSIKGACLHMPKQADLSTHMHTHTHTRLQTHTLTC